MDRFKFFAFVSSVPLLVFAPSAGAGLGGQGHAAIVSVTVTGEGPDHGGRRGDLPGESQQLESVKQRAVLEAIHSLGSDEALSGAALFPLAVQMTSFNYDRNANVYQRTSGGVSHETKTTWEAVVQTLAVGVGAPEDPIERVRLVVRDGTTVIAQGEYRGDVADRALDEILRPNPSGYPRLKLRPPTDFSPAVGARFIGLAEDTDAYLKDHPASRPTIDVELTTATGATSAFPVTVQSTTFLDALRPSLSGRMSKAYLDARGIWRSIRPAPGARRACAAIMQAAMFAARFE